MKIERSLSTMIMLLMLWSYSFAQEGTLEAKVTDESQDLYEMSLEDLLNIEITTASKNAEKQSDAPGIISVLTKDEINRFGGTFLIDVIERIPGFSSGSVPYSNRTTIIARGDFVKQNSSHVLLLINGRPIREIQEGGNSSEVLKTFPVSIVEKIEVIRGPGSVLYGSDAFSGVINIITDKADQNRVSIAGLAGNGFRTYADLVQKTDDFNIVASGQYHKKQIWDVPFIYQDFSTGVLKDSAVNLEIPDYGAGIFLKAGYKGLSIQTTFNQWHTLGTQLLNDVTNEKIFTNLGYNTSVSDNWAMDFNITYAYTKLLGEMLSKRKSKNFIAEWTNNITLSEKSKLAIGGLVNNINGSEFDIQNPENVSEISKGNRTGIALYAQLDYRLLNNLKFIGGVQANKDGEMDLNIVPRGGVIWNPHNRLSLKALYSQAYRAPSINELYMNFEAGLYGDEDLKPEKVSTFDIGINYQGEKTQFGLSIFKSMMKDIIQPVPTGEGFAREYANLQSVDFTGGELEGKYYVNRNVYFTGSVSYQTNTSGDDSNVTPVANLSVKGGASVRTNNGILISFFNIYQGDPDEKFLGIVNPEYKAYNILNLHSELELNEILNFDSKSKFSILFDVDNLFDKEVFKYEWGGFSGSTIPAIPGRAIYAGIKVTI